MFQLRGRIWQFLRRFRNSLNFTPPTPRLLLFPMLDNPTTSVFGPVVTTGKRVNTVLEAVNFILSIFPTRWPLPLTVVSATIFGALTVATNSWVLYDIASDLVMNNEMIATDQKCQSINYDYIIVGGGTAGLIVATRLANASRNIKVLLLEAGGEPSLLNDIPALDLFLLKQPANTWSYESLHQEHVCQNCLGQRTSTSKGKMLGGSSSINFMMYVRGNKEDFNRWAVDANDEQWSYENVLPYFKLSEDYNGEYANDLEGKSDQYHGKGGLLNVATHSFMPGVDGFLAAGVEKGYKIGDYNGEEQEVFSKIDVTTQDGLRESVYRAFYQDTGKPPNLCIKKYAYASKIHFNQVREKIKAVAVTYHRHDITRTVTATKEVILSAGAFGTPKLLMLSGVGPAKDLMSLDIPVLKDLPVGRNLQNQPFAIVGPFIKGPSLNPNRDLTVRSLGEMVVSGDGPGAAPAGLAGQAFFKSPLAESSYPDLQIVHLSLGLFGEISQTIHDLTGLREDIFSDWLDPYPNLNIDARMPIIVLGRQKSVGYLSLSTKNPRDDLIIDPKYLEHPDDREAMLYGFKTVVDLFENTSALNAPYFSKSIRGCEDEVFKSDEYFKCAISHMSGALAHHVGTCALGKVVDSKLRVKGIDGLRIIDASVIPRSLNGGPLAATVMIGEKGADFVIYDLFNPPEHNHEHDAVVISDSRNSQ